MSVMRAKMMITRVEKFEGSDNEKLHFCAVAKDSAYPPDGSDEDNSYARWTPSGMLELQIGNPDLYGRFTEGDRFYLDFTPVPDRPG